MFMCGTLIVSRRTYYGLFPSISCLQESPEDSLLFQEQRMALPETVAPTFDMSNDVLLRSDPSSYPFCSYSTDSVESDQSDSHLSDSYDSSSLSSVEPVGGLNSYLQSLIVKQQQTKAKERRLRRMQILKMRRKNGLISFDVKPLRYESKRRR
ncbi:uncharacterized protein [Blastocystis hominis]|uniref:Uncharacterized protein n=1 Tax=Blastocystis hominis TaxID=12968 RepID=D8LXD2_BLAHO|nr:uncharacterized protein [Blastocystis hominis]CBK20927.2 unnamed protein product [Blastocystis hominis]|eukprot:XP_012894975.1 uncharacterized protein [Blastocystis hominis]